MVNAKSFDAVPVANLPSTEKESESLLRDPYSSRNLRKVTLSKLRNLRKVIYVNYVIYVKYSKTMCAKQ